MIEGQYDLERKALPTSGFLPNRSGSQIVYQDEFQVALLPSNDRMVGRKINFAKEP
jgi:hypothetical protein